LETLAIIAYKQPITRVEIEEIRGVGCELMLKKLQAMELITESGRAESVGKPILYSITESFLDLFKLMSLDELPNLPTYEDRTEESQLFE
jgi:segregation and condensation protein B